MKRSLLSIALIPVVFGGCAGPIAQSNKDRFTGATINTTTGNELPRSIWGGPILLLDVREEISASNDKSYFLILGSPSGPPAIGESLFLLADTHRLSFKTALTHRGWSYLYPATEQSLRTICASTNIELRVIGSGGHSVDRKLSAENRRVFRDFGEKYLGLK